MNVDLKDIPAKLAPIGSFFKRYVTILFIIGVVSTYGLLVFQISNLERAEPTDEAVAEKLKTVQRPQIDQAVLDKIQKLQSQNIEVQSLFKQARENPFTD